MTRTIVILGALLALALIAPAAQANIGPVGQWRLDEGSGSVLVDSSGNGDNGTATGGVTWTAGPSGSALAFDGTGGVRIPDAPQLEPSAAITVAAWVATTGSPGSYKYVVAKGANRCTSASYGLYSGPNGGLEFYIARGQGTIYARSPDAGWGVWDGRWHLAVGTFDGTTIRLYVDGAEVGFGTQYPGPIEYLLNDTNDLFIGDYPSCSNLYFPGAISDVRIWNRALSAADVFALSAPTQPPPTGGSNPPSIAPQTPAATTTPTGGNTGGPGPVPQNQPVLRMASIRPTTLKVGLGPVSRSAPVITYNDSVPARVTFTILRVRSRQPQMRCVTSARLRHRSPVGFCPRLIALGRFVHQDHPGSNRVRFPRHLTPPPGSYVLDVTPALKGNVGKTIVIPFRVVANRQEG
jgi:hypothetical protein